MLHVRGARHRNAEIALGLRGNCTQERSECRPNFACRVLHVHPELSGHHFVAAAASVELCAERTKFLDQRGFGEMVDVFGFRASSHAESDCARDLDFIERGYKTLAFFAREDSGSGNSARPGAVESKFVREKPAVELPRALEFVKRSVGTAVEAPAPHFLPFGNGHRTAASSGTVMGSAKRLMKPSASFGL